MGLGKAATLGLIDWRTTSNSLCGNMNILSNSGDFEAQMLEVQVGDVTLFETRTEAQTIQRLPEQITSSTPKYCKLFLQLEGKARISQEGRSSVIGEGDLSLFMTNRPYELNYPGPQHNLIVYFPQSMVRVPQERLLTMTAVPISREDDLGRIAVVLFEQLADNIETLKGPHGFAFLRSALDMFATALASKINSAAGDHPQSNAEMIFQKSVKFIEENLGKQDLSVQTVADSQFVSVRYIQRIFASQGESVGSMVRSMRMDQLRKDLANPDYADRSISQLAHRLGMADASYASRSFKTAFGESPRAYRVRLSER